MELSMKYKSTLTEQLFSKKILLQYNFSLYIHIYCQITNFGVFAAFSPFGVFLENQYDITSEKKLKAPTGAYAAYAPVGAFKK